MRSVLFETGGTSHDYPRFWIQVSPERIRVRYPDPKFGPGFPGWRPEADPDDPGSPGAEVDDEPAKEKWIFKIGPAQNLSFSNFMSDAVKNVAHKYGIPAEVLRDFMEKK